MLNRILKRLFIFKSVITFNPFIGNKKYKSFFKKFNNQLQEKTNTKLDRYYKLRFHEINSIVSKYKIQNVLELGTGRTTDGILGLFKRDPGKSFKENLDQSIIDQTRSGFDLDKVKASRDIESFYFDSNSQVKIGSYNDTSGLFQKGLVKAETGSITAADPITARLPVVGKIQDTDLGDTTESYFDDIIDFNFKIVSPRSKADDAEVTVLFFRAYLESLDDNIHHHGKVLNI